MMNKNQRRVHVQHEEVPAESTTKADAMIKRLGDERLATAKAAAARVNAWAEHEAEVLRHANEIGIRAIERTSTGAGRRQNPHGKKRVGR